MRNRGLPTKLVLPATVLAQAALLAFHFLNNPIFPSHFSEDFIQYVRILGSYSQGQFGSLTGNLLYGGVFFYLDLWGRAFPGFQPEVLTQYAMAALVLVSPVLVYGASRSITSSKKAGLVCAALWTLSGTVWFGAVFNSGLYANFVGILASLAYVWVSIGYIRAKKVGVFRLILVALTVGLAYFSHYTTLYVLGLFQVFLLLEARKKGVMKRGVGVAAITWLPALIGLVLFPSVLSTLRQFVSGTGSPTLAGPSFPTTLASAMPFAALTNLVDLVNDDFLALFMLACLVPFCWAALKERRWLSLFLVAWFALALAAAPPNSANWRSSFMALIPLGMIAGAEVSKLWRDGWNFAALTSSKKSWKANDRGHPGLKAMGLMAVLVFPIFLQSWGFQSVSEQDVASVQRADYQAMMWMNEHKDCGYLRPGGYNFTGPSAYGLRTAHSVSDWVPAPCTFVSVADPFFAYYQVMGGNVVLLADGAGVAWSDPAQVSFYAIQNHVQMLIVTKAIDQTPPSQSYTTLTASTPAQLESKVTETQAGFHGYGALSYSPPVLEPNGEYSTSASIVLDPWHVYNQTSLQVSLPPLYNSTGVEIWCLDSAACGRYAP